MNKPPLYLYTHINFTLPPSPAVFWLQKLGITYKQLVDYIERGKIQSHKQYTEIFNREEAEEQLSALMSHRLSHIERNRPQSD